jgi:hypothetical protein
MNFWQNDFFEEGRFDKSTKARLRGKESKLCKILGMKFSQLYGRQEFPMLSIDHDNLSARRFSVVRAGVRNLAPISTSFFS